MENVKNKNKNKVSETLLSCANILKAHPQVLKNTCGSINPFDIHTWMRTDTFYDEDEEGNEELSSSGNVPTIICRDDEKIFIYNLMY